MISSSVLHDATRRALASGALHSIETQTIVHEDDGVHFILRAVASFAHKARAPSSNKTTDALGNDVDLFVTNLGACHRLLLNKYPVVSGHALLVTRQFEPQERTLSVEDFAALNSCLREIDGLGFYNGGADAGASQRHKHLHLVPLPVALESPDEVPVERVVTGGRRLPFRYAFARIAADETASGLHAVYRELLEQCGIPGVVTAEGELQSAPYNLLVRRSWMFLVPRSVAGFESIMINALAFAGALVVPSQEHLERVRRIGPMRLLSAVAMAPNA